MSDTTFKKVIIVGDRGVGKSAFVQRIKTGKFIKEYIPTILGEVHPIVVWGHGIKLWDMAGLNEFGEGETEYYINSDLAIVIYDGTSDINCKNVNYWIFIVRKICPTIPILIIRTKEDLHGVSNNIYEYENETISAMTGKNVNKVLNIIHSILYTTN